jgi:glycosyltransferase involved in cell wall biosynthesis
MIREVRHADIVHVRGPCNVALIGLALLAVLRRPEARWFKYAGNWRPDGPEAWSYRVQRYWLERGWSGGLTTVNGRWPRQPGHVRSFLNPCLNDDELEEGARCARGKHLGSPVRLLFVGALNRPKGVGRALEVLARVRRAGVDAVLELIGDGPERPDFERQAGSLGLGGSVAFLGWLPRTDLGPVYARAHVLLHPSASCEGWPKVLSEAMAYGAVPVAGAISSIPQILAETGAGLAVEPTDPEALAAAVVGLATDPGRWSAFARAAVSAAPAFSFGAYVGAVRDLLGEIGVFPGGRPRAAGVGRERCVTP